MEGDTEDKWLGSTVTYEGQPMALRIRVDADEPANRHRYRALVALTHELAKVQPNGFPEPSYNARLLELDVCIVAALDAGGRGITILIETLNGQRTYYAYCETAEHGESAIAKVHRLHPGHQLSVTARADSDWELLETYRRLFPW